MLDKKAQRFIEAIADGDSWIYRQTHIERDDPALTLRMIQKFAREYVRDRAYDKQQLQAHLRAEAIKWCEEEGVDPANIPEGLAEFAFDQVENSEDFLNIGNFLGKI